MNDFLSIEKVSKHFGPLKAVDEVTLQISQGEIFSLLGPSGCGKTTLLKMLAGFEKPDEGRLILNGEEMTALPPERRPVNTVFQNYALFPHLSVWENIAFGLRIAGKAKGEIKEAVERMLGLIQLGDHARKRPAQLSGGQRQRVAIARALVNEPKVLLLDEPLAALDLKLRQHMLAELQSIHAQVGTTFIYVTHDQGEALSLSHRIAVMEAGRVSQVDSPRGLYEAPTTSFVAGFIGDANFLEATVEEPQSGGFVRVKMEGMDSPLVVGQAGLRVGDRVRVMIRPEKLHLTLERPLSHQRVNIAKTRIEEVTYFGPHMKLQTRSGGQRLHIQQSTREALLTVGTEAWMSFAPEAGRVVD
ncbi:spermidine/putrescine transport system ATP-binding protein [Prosthecobacter fusiformis]|uniref:Spermidine/putrescine import ATP-binding protein PotA n=1 Tax=Prosthecobacter fusiformis TaxID=48464 RepID=A0A4R7SQH3_9BACT|nr:ABC transporter ATP-binding protein [Prosthecobacter fusiformis]TDU81281.1 spermidine/putrescine transport system ATP-binding protein [Prosthecobacter fusiformis]